MRMYLAVDAAVIQFKSRLSLPDICDFDRLEINNFLCVCCSSHVLILVIPVLEKFKSIGTNNGTPPKPYNVFLISLTSLQMSATATTRKKDAQKGLKTSFFFYPEWEMIANTLSKGELRVLIFKVGSGVFPSGG